MRMYIILSAQTVDVNYRVFRLDSIDLYVGGMTEKPTRETGLLGPTFTCLLAEQFREMKLGDRFFFTHDDAGFTRGACAS